MLDGLKVAVIVTVAAVLQAAVFADVTILGATPDLLLVSLVSVALLHGPVVGAVAGFWAGLLIDTEALARLGVTSLLLTLAGYWIGRYGETTGRDRSHAPLLSVAVVTSLYAVGALAFRFVLGDPAPAERVFDTLLQTIGLNLLLTWPVYRLVRRLLPSVERVPRAERIAVG